MNFNLLSLLWLLLREVLLDALSYTWYNVYYLRLSLHFPSFFNLIQRSCYNLLFVLTVEENELFDFRGLRMDWFRLQVTHILVLS